ncbi:MAG TPA: xanthine dehydrogenase accessory protein XdhC [Anaeromyxobacteraceae bacterium]|nr:xanthine dehydrogenase accessory protein XdhC [Anaeromyxobacteraceae bacterium]
MNGWLEALASLQAAGRPAILVTVLRADGSTPREAGAKMVVGEDATYGSIGGGHLELEAIRVAREMVREGAQRPRTPVSRDFSLGPSLGQCCGGAVTLLFEAVLPARWRVSLFGAGHVGRALVKLLADLPCLVDWYDSREGEFPGGLASSVRPVVTDDPAGEVPDLPAGSDVVVMTHSHELDLAIVAAALRRRDLPFVGLIGSRTKRARFEARLSERGFGTEDLGRLVCPVGVPGAGGKLPAEIAISVAAQLLQRRGAPAQ